MKSIFVGDPHIQVSNIPDGDRLFSFVKKTQKEVNANNLIILGDLFHTHAVLRLEVISFWQRTIFDMSKLFETVILLVGNHDMVGDKQREGQMSALDTLKVGLDNVKIIDKPEQYKEWAFVPYFSDSDKFINESNKLADLGSKTLICHQTFDGSQFENGFYAPEGIDQKCLNFKQIISGHIHKTQVLGKVFYPGTPKWDTLSDANEPKGIWIYENENWTMLDTSPVIEPIRSYKITPDSNLDELKIGPKTIIELEGPSAWIGPTSKKLKGKCKLAARPTDSLEKRKIENRASSVFDFLQNYSGVTNKSKVKSYLEALCSKR